MVCDPWSQGCDPRAHPSDPRSHPFDPWSHIPCYDPDTHPETWSTRISRFSLGSLRQWLKYGHEQGFNKTQFPAVHRHLWGLLSPSVKSLFRKEERDLFVVTVAYSTFSCHLWKKSLKLLHEGFIQSKQASKRLQSCLSSTMGNLNSLLIKALCFAHSWKYV